MARFNYGSVALLTMFIFFFTWAGLGRKTRHVRVTNALEGGSTLTINCRSEDDDIGIQVLQPQDSFEFHFKPTFIGITRFYCSFQLPDASIYWFDVYNHWRDGRDCSECYWVIRDGGPCMFNWDNQQYDICYKWS